MTAMKWFYSFLRKHNRSMALGLVLVTVISILAIVKPIVSGSIVDDVITGGNFDLLPGLIALLVLITVLRGVMRYWSQVIFETCSQDVLYSMRDTVYRKLLQEDFNFYNKKRTGDLLGRHSQLEARALHVRGTALCPARDTEPDKGGAPALPADPGAVLLPQHLRPGECQRKPRGQGVLQGRLRDWKI